MEGDFVRADYINPKGLARSGWLPRSAITPLPDQSGSGPDDWIGQWAGSPEQALSIIKRPRLGEIRIKGNATSVAVGDIEAAVKPDGSSVAFTMGSGRTLPFEHGDQYDDRVRMRRLGSFLLVEDNRNCGGLNVSFAEAYRKRR